MFGKLRPHGRALRAMMPREAPADSAADAGGDEERLRRQAYASAMAELVAHIAHAVNQPLAAIAANANASVRWLAGQPPNIEEARAASARIVRDARRASDVITEMRTFLARTSPPRETIVLQDLVDEAVAEARGAAQDAQVALRYECAAQPVRLVARRSALRQALTHLIDNAVEACAGMPAAQREVHVRLHAPYGGEIVFEVEDRGSGFDAEAPQRLFEPLFTTKPGRLGMGLAVSRSVIEEQGGRVLAKRGEDARTRFIVTLPLDAAAP